LLFPAAAGLNTLTPPETASASGPTNDTAQPPAPLAATLKLNTEHLKLSGPLQLCIQTSMKKPFTLSLLTAIALVLAGCVTAHSWEYRTRTTHERLGKSMLDEYGNAGWELVQFQRIPVVQTDTNHIATTNLEYEYIFKRPKR
jgi:hypothetical protein